MINSIDNMTHKNIPQGKVIIIGKIYADWCGHCIALEPEWKAMKTRINTDMKNAQIEFEEVEQKEENEKLPLINNTYLSGSDKKLALQGGYPTIFCIKENVVDYYNGSRDANSIYEWCVSKIDDQSSPSEKVSSIQMNKMVIPVKLRKTRKMRKTRKIRNTRKSRKYRKTNKSQKRASKTIYE